MIVVIPNAHSMFKLNILGCAVPANHPPKRSRQFRSMKMGEKVGDERERERENRKCSEMVPDSFRINRIAERQTFIATHCLTNLYIYIFLLPENRVSETGSLHLHCRAVPCSLTLTAHKLCSANKGERIVQMPNDCFIFLVCPARSGRVCVCVCAKTSLTFDQKRRETTKVKLPVCRSHLTRNFTEREKKDPLRWLRFLWRREKTFYVVFAFWYRFGCCELFDPGKLNRLARHCGENKRTHQAERLICLCGHSFFCKKKKKKMRKGE